MAARRSGVPLVPVVVLLLGNVVLSITLYVIWQKKELAELQTLQAVAEAEKAKQAQGTAISRLNSAKKRLNRQTELDFDRLLAAVDEDIRQFGGAPNDSYADVVRHLQNLVDSFQIELKALTADKDRLQQEYVALQSIKQVAVNEATSASQEAREELVTERSDFQRKLSGKDQEFAAIMDRANTLASKLETEQRDKGKIREELLGQVNKLRKILVEARAPYAPNALARQTPDGKVIRASAATKTVWLNIGSKDGVQPQLTFSVQPAGFAGNPFTKPKAKLEVVKVTGLNLCEARITEGSLTNLIIEGDLIYTPAWHPGKVMRFALAGLLDMDGDGIDDRNRIKQIISIAGAKVDAEIMPDGTEHGEVTVETNYFIRGARPDPEKAGPSQLRVLAAMSRMERTALDYGATVIDLSKFLDLMGYTPTNRLQSSSSPSLTPGSRPANQ